ncbi:MAG TPA: tRNA-guanine transglycosylase, partial [Leptospiraceae bacterium]|nr:tRNA-guanine transglycosylase [Leptospiraceae bacterium]
VCRRYSRAYIRHLFMSDEMLGPQLMSFHNLAFFYTFMEEMRGSIRAGRFATFYLQWKEWDKNGPDE